MLLTLHLYRVLAHILSMSFIRLGRPRTFALHAIYPNFHGSLTASLRRWHALLLLVHQVVDIAADSVMLELPVHEFRTVPVLLATRGQSFTPIDSHDVPGYLSRTKVQKNEKIIILSA